MDKYFVYFLQSILFKDKFYIGVTADLFKRLEKHNRGFSKSTKPYKPWRIIYYEIFNNKFQAYKREYYLKHPEGYLEKKKIIEKYKIR